MRLSILNTSKGTVIAAQAKAATSWIDRFRGLLGTSSLQVGEGLWITPCHSVHTFFMRYAIDILFLDGQGVVIARATLAPWRFSAWERRAAGVLELAAGAIQRTGTEVGDRLSMKPV